jgi:hypothetical protein
MWRSPEDLAQWRASGFGNDSAGLRRRLLPDGQFVLDRARVLGVSRHDLIHRVGYPEPEALSAVLLRGLVASLPYALLRASRPRQKRGRLAFSRHCTEASTALNTTRQPDQCLGFNTENRADVGRYYGNSKERRVVSPRRKTPFGFPLIAEEPDGCAVGCIYQPRFRG